MGVVSPLFFIHGIDLRRLGMKKWMAVTVVLFLACVVMLAIGLVFNGSESRSAMFDNKNAVGQILPPVGEPNRAARSEELKGSENGNPAHGPASSQPASR